MLLVVLVLAVVFDYINGFHDTANAIATSVATRALRPQHAILMAAAFNFIGALTGTAVAKTIGAGLVDDAEHDPGDRRRGAPRRDHLEPDHVVARPPELPSHALIGGLLGATIVAAGIGALKCHGVSNKVLVPLVPSPILGFALAPSC